MFYHRLIFKIIPLSIFVLFTACGEYLSSSPTLTPSSEIIISPNKTAIVGRMISSASSKPLPLSNIAVRLAKMFWNEDRTEGVFVLEGATSPGDITDEQGYFSIIDIEPGEYVIVVGEAIGNNEIITETSGKAKIFIAEKDTVLDVGTLEVN